MPVLAGQEKYLLPPRIQTRGRKKWARFYHMQWLTGALAPTYRIVIPLSVGLRSSTFGQGHQADGLDIYHYVLQGGKNPKRHTTVCDSEAAASEAAVAFCKNRRRFRTRSLEKAYRDPAYKHLRDLKAEEAPANLAALMPQVSKRESAALLPTC